MAGTGAAGFAGDLGPATSAVLNFPTGLALVGEERAVEVFAGTGADGFSGDGGPATEAELTCPIALPVDRLGTLYIGGSSRIRAVTPDGTIPTIAGTADSGFTGGGSLATEVTLTRPRLLAVHQDGDVYVLDHDRVLGVDRSGRITSLPMPRLEPTQVVASRHCRYQRPASSSSATGLRCGFCGSGSGGEHRAGERHGVAPAILFVIEALECNFRTKCRVGARRGGSDLFRCSRGWDDAMADNTEAPASKDSPWEAVRRSPWLVVAPILTFVAGLLLGVTVVGAGNLGTDRDDAITAAPSAAPSRSPEPSPSPSPSEPQLIVRVPMSCLDIADEASAARGQVEEAAAAARDLDARRLREALDALQTLQRRVEALAEECEARARTETTGAS